MFRRGFVNWEPPGRLEPLTFWVYSFAIHIHQLAIDSSINFVDYSTKEFTNPKDLWGGPPPTLFLVVSNEISRALNRKSVGLTVTDPMSRDLSFLYLS